MNPEKILELLEQTNNLSAFNIEIATEKGTLQMSFTPNAEVKGEQPKASQDLSFLAELKC